MKIALWALALSILWTAVLLIIVRTIGLHTAPGMWTGTLGLPGVVLANWTQRHIFHGFHRPLGYTLMFLINWVFYCSVLQGLLSFRKLFWD